MASFSVRFVNGGHLRDLVIAIVVLFLVVHEGAPMVFASDDVVAPAAVALDTAFTYQGRLVKSGSPANGTHDFVFQLFDAAAGGNAVGPANVRNGVTVSGGLFSVQLDAGAVFTGEKRWLEVKVSSGGGPLESVGRQELTATPYALYSSSAAFATTAAVAPWTGITGIPAGFLDGIDADALGTLGSCPATQVVKWNGAAWACAPDMVAAAGAGDITAVVAGTGLTGGATSGDATLNVAFGGNGTANTVSRSDHDHLYQDWFGSDPNTASLTIRNLDSLGTALSTEGGRLGLLSLAGSDNAYGVWGQADGTNSVGVRGTGFTGMQAEGGAFGIRAFSNQVAGQAVRGHAAGGNGVVGTSTATGYAATAGINSGTGCTSGSFESMTDSCVGLYGEALQATLAIGVIGKGKTYGVLGEANGTSSPNGVRGVTTVGAGVGVEGINRNASCIWDGYFGDNCAGTAGVVRSLNGVGVVGMGGKWGVYGRPDLNVINGGVGVYGDTTAPATQWAGYFNGRIFASSVVVPSDARLKTNLGDAYGLSEVMRLEPVAYDLIADDGHRHQGLIAQDLREVLPELVSETDVAGGEPRLAVNYIELIPVLVRAIQEQQAEIATLTSDGTKATARPQTRSGSIAGVSGAGLAIIVVAGIAASVAIGEVRARQLCRRNGRTIASLH
ncbi:hypothetical protein AYO38_01435 [bacterium SCGC AG-212-C10]|nr:hypothetical protein AYO38_01435 [bacterium SCGC AG-212-C10]